MRLALINEMLITAECVVMISLQQLGHTQKRQALAEKASHMLTCLMQQGHTQAK
jgi:hypothetical protein